MNRILTYPIPDGVAVNDRYTVKIRPAGESEWTQIKCYNVMVDMHDVRNASMAFFDFEGEVEVEISVDIKCFWIYKADIRPLSKKIKADINVNTAGFKLTNPENLSIELNKDRFHNLHLFAGKINESFKSTDTENTIRVEGDFNGEALAGRLVGMPKGRTVIFSQGMHKAEDLKFMIPSHTNVVLEGGAVVAAAFECENVENINISGHGVIYQADVGRSAGVSGLAVKFSKNISIDGLIFVNPPYYTVTLGASSDVSVKNIKSFSCCPWCDGIDIMSCSNITIDGCFLRTSDDCIAVYGSRWHYKGDSRNISVKNSTLWADVAHPINIGTHGDHEANGDILEEIIFKDLDILEHHELQPGYLGCMAINCGDKNTVRNVLFEDIRVEPFEHGRLIDLRVRMNPDYNPAPGNGIENIRFNNISYNGAEEEPSVIEGYDETRMVKNIEINKLYINGRQAHTIEEANIEIRSFSGNITVL